jgi:hypothetical protein
MRLVYVSNQRGGSGTEHCEVSKLSACGYRRAAVLCYYRMLSASFSEWL